MFNGLAFLNKDENDFDGFLAAAASNEKSNLADIFDTDVAEKPDDANPSLKYIPPKGKPLQKDNDKSTWNVVIAKIVNAYKLVNDDNSSLGLLGLAVLNNPNEDASKLILYKTKDQILSTLLLSNSSKVYWKPPYLQFHDDLNGFWSLLFSNDADCNEFITKLKKVCAIDCGDTPKSETNATVEKPPMNLEIPAKFSEPKHSANDKIDETDTTNSSTGKTKSDVVYRVAKIGHQLPKIKPIPDDDSDDSTLPSDVENVPSMQSHKSVYNNPLASTHLPPKPANISVALQSPFWSSSSFDLNTFAAENRIQNTEFRMNISNLDSKLDRVLDNIERLRLNSSKNENVHDEEGEIIKLEEKLLDLKKENRLLKLRLTEKEQVNKVSNDKEKEELTAMGKSNEEKELKINELTNKLKEVENELNMEKESKEMENEKLSEKYTTDFNTLREELEQKNKELEALQQSKAGNANNGETIRKIMNQFYVKLYESIQTKESMTSADILKLTAEIIRKETKSALNPN